MFLFGIYIGGLIVTLLHITVITVDRSKLYGINPKEIIVDCIGVIAWPVSISIVVVVFLYDLARS